MKCKYCGAELKNGSIYCPKCGKDIQLVSDIALEDEYLSDFLERKSKKSSRSTTRNTDLQKNSNIDQKQNKKLAIVSVLVVLFVLIIMVSIIVFVIQYKKANSFDYQYEQAKAAQASGKTEKAISFYERSLKLQPKNVDVRVALGSIYLEQKDYDSALLNFEEAVNLDDTNIDAYIGLIQVYKQKKEYDKISALADSIDDVNVTEALEGYLVSPPKFSVEGGEYEEVIELELTAEDDCKILYTTDGKDPIQYGEQYHDAFTFDKEGEYEVKAVCVNEEGIYSGVASHKYNITILAPEAPVVTPEGGNYTIPTLISISVPAHCTAYYTWDGSDPNVTSNVYREPIEVPEGSNIFSVVIVNNLTDRMSPIYRSNYTYYN